MVEGYGNPWMVHTLTSLHSLLALIGSASLHEPDRIQRSVNEHRAILAAIEAGAPDEAASATLTHIHSVEQDCIRHLSDETPQPAGV